MSKSQNIPHIKHYSIIRLGRLLDMMYRPSEIAAELDVSVDTIYRSWLTAGLPHKRDKDGTIWIHGLTLVTWAKSTIAARRKKPHGLQVGQGWCMRCNRAVLLANPKQIYQNRYIEIMQAPCPDCGTPVNRAQKRSVQ